MSINQFPGGIIRGTPVVPAGPLASGAAPGVWTLDEATNYIKQGIWPIAGNNLYIEDVFSTYLYTGNSSTQTITNGIDLSGNGGLVWFKSRSNAAPNALFDTARGANKSIRSNSTAAQEDLTSFGISALTSFTSTGFQLGDDVGFGAVNTSPNNYTSWTFRKQAKFFDVVTYTGTGANRTIAHNLGSVPGCIIVKATSTTGNWITYHRSLGNTDFVNLNTTAVTAADSGAWNNTSPTSTEFSLGTGNTNVNGATYVAYLFAHDAGGFGVSGSDNVISCGSFTTDGSGNATVSLGYEPQWCMFKRVVGGTGNWTILDNMRGWPVGGNDNQLQANLSTAETSASDISAPNATGFSVTGISASSTYIYIAIRRGPMKTPTSGTSVYNASTWGGGTSGYTVTGAGFPPDTVLLGWQTSLGGNSQTWFDRLRGTSPALYTAFTVAEDSTYPISSFDQNGFKYSGSNWTAAGYNRVQWMFRRAPGFFDVVCYTGTGSSPQTINHNLGVAPQLIISRRRSPGGGWWVGTNFTSTQHMYLQLNDTAAGTTVDYSSASTWVSNPGVSSYTVSTTLGTSSNPYNWVSYLFATVAGVSKVGSYTGTGTTKQIDCGFTGGARFVLIKRTDSTGDWYVWDSARGIVAGNDPYLLLNSTAAEVTGTDYVDTYAAGFEISSTAPAAINANGGSFIFLAIA